MLTQDVRNEGFRQLSLDYFERVSPSPETCWRTTFTLADVHAGIPAARSGHKAETTARDELLDALWAGEDQLVVGRAGEGKSTLCKQAAVAWYHADPPGNVLYRESGRGGRPFESTGALVDAIEQADSPVLVVVEDAIRPQADAILGVMERFRDVPDVRFLLDARQADVDQFTSTDTADQRARRHVDLLGEIPRYQLPPVSEADVARVVEAFEEATGRTVGRDPTDLHAEVRGEGAEEFGAFLLLSFHLPVGGDTLDGDRIETGLEAHVRARYKTLTEPASAGALRNLSEFDTGLLADVGVMVNLLNAAGIGIHPELVHALAYEHGPSIDADDDPTDVRETLADVHDEIADIRAALEGWFLSPTGGDEGPARTTHELWSTLYLRHLARKHAADQADSRRRDRSEPHTGRCLDALFRLCDDEDRREALAREFPGSAILASITDDPEATATEYVEAVFELGERWPVLAPLFGTTRTARYDLPETVPENTRCWLVTTRGHTHRNRGAYAKARTEYERRLEQASKTDNKTGEAIGLNNLGLVATSLGEYETAQQYHQQSLEIKHEIGDRNGEATSLEGLGLVAKNLGEYETARQYYDAARDLYSRLGQIREELRVRRNRIRLERDADNLHRARERCEAVFNRLDNLGRDLPDEREQVESLCDQLDEE